MLSLKPGLPTEVNTREHLEKKKKYRLATSTKTSTRSTKY